MTTSARLANRASRHTKEASVQLYTNQCSNNLYISKFTSPFKLWVLIIRNWYKRITEHPTKASDDEVSRAEIKEIDTILYGSYCQAEVFYY